jgi:hypothetical protein
MPFDELACQLSDTEWTIGAFTVTTAVADFEGSATLVAIIVAF